MGYTNFGMHTPEGNRHVDAMMGRVIHLVKSDQPMELVATRLAEMTASIRRSHSEVDSDTVRQRIRGWLTATRGPAYADEIMRLAALG